MEGLFGVLRVFNGYPEPYDNFLFLDFPFKERESVLSFTTPNPGRTNGPRIHAGLCSRRVPHNLKLPRVPSIPEDAS